MTLTLTGSATSHANADDVSNLTITFTDDAFANEAASRVGGTSKSDIVVDFTDASSIAYTGTLAEAAANDGSITGSIVATLTGDTFTANVVSANHVSASNVPAGLTASFTRTSDTKVTLTLTGSATNHANANDISNLTITFADGAFTTETAATVAGSTKSDIAIDFRRLAAGTPSVSMISFGTSPASGDTFGVGEAIGVSVTFDEGGIAVTGTPRVALTVGSATRYATYTDHRDMDTTTGVRFSYTVRAGDLDTDGVSIAANALELNGGMIRDTDVNDADLVHAAIANDGARKVDGGPADTTAPTLSTAAVNGNALVLTYNEALDTASVPATGDFTVTVAGSTRSVSNVAVAGSAVTLTLASAVVAADTVTVSYTAPSGAGANPIRDAAGNNAANLSNHAVTNATPGIVLSVSALTVAEGGSADYTVRLNTQPSGNVTVTVARAAGGSTDVSFDTSANSGVQTTPLTFTTVNWSMPQTVTVGVSDDDDTTNDAATLTHTAVGGGYGAYSADLAVTVTDNDTDSPNNAPAFAFPSGQTSYTFDLAENDDGSTTAVAVGTVTATDADTGDTVRYSIASGNTGRVFAIGSSSGAITYTGSGENFEGFTAPASAFTLTVRASDGKANTDATVTIRVTDVDSEAPGKPDAPAFGAATATSLVVNWSAPANTGPDVTDYDVQFQLASTAPSGVWTAHAHDGTGTTATIGSLQAGTAYHVQVRATNAEGTSGWSDPGVATTATAEGATMVEIPLAGDDTISMTTDVGVTFVVHIGDDGRTELNFRAPAGSPLAGVTLTLPVGTDEVTAKRLDVLPDGAAEPPDGAEPPDDLLAAAVDLDVPAGSRVCLPLGAGTGVPAIYRFDGMRWERATVMDQFVDGALVCGTVTMTSPFAVFREGSAAALANAATVWLGHFGRTAANQVLEAVDARMAASRTAGTELTLGGQPVALDGAVNAGDAEDAAAARDIATWLRLEEDSWEKRGREPQGRGMTQREFLLGSSFSVAKGDERNGHYALWGRGTVSSFDGRDGDLTVNGEVASAFLGADWSRERTTLGLIFGHTVGDGGYASVDRNGKVSTTLTGFYPWMRQEFGERVSAWGVAGYGAGRLTVTPENADGSSAAALRSDLSLTMGAVGLRGTLVEAPEAGGIELAVKTDAMAVRTRSAAVGGAGGDLARVSAEVTRFRLGLESTRVFRFEGGASLTPTFEVGVRRDGGDIETGMGVDVGGGIAWSDPERGLSVDLRGRRLLSHEAKGFRESGLSGSLAWDGRPDSARGPSLTLSQSVGARATGGMDALLERGSLAGLAANDDDAGDGPLGGHRFEATFGYGMGAFGDRFTATPELGFVLSDTGRDYRLGWRLVRENRAGKPGSLEFLFEAVRREAANDNGADTGPDHAVGFELTARF